MGLNIVEAQLTRRVTIPLADGDSRITLDATLTSAAAALAAGFSLDGAGHVFDERGYNGKGLGSLGMTSFANAAAMAPNGTIYLQFERRSVATAEVNNGGAFIDSNGHSAAANRTILNTTTDTANYTRRILGNTFLSFLNTANSTAATTNFNRFNSHSVPGYQDPFYVEVIWTWKGTDYWIYVDGHPFFHGTSAAAPTALDFKNVRVGAGGTSSNTIGDYYIRRIQLSTAFAPPVMVPLRVAALGDSFVKRASGAADPGADTVAGINAVQFMRAIGDMQTPYGYVTGQTSWGLGLEALAWQELGAYFPLYLAAKSGGGYEKNVIPTAYTDAVNAFKPELLIALSSVNDVSVASPVTAIVANTKAKLDEVIDGNAALRQILLFVGFSGHLNPPQVATAGWLAEYKRINTLLIDGMNGYRDKVKVVPVYDAWGGDNYPKEQTVGSAPTNATATAANDIHPSPSGFTRMTAIMWPHVRSFLTSNPG